MRKYVICMRLWSLQHSIDILFNYSKSIEWNGSFINYLLEFVSTVTHFNISNICFVVFIPVFWGSNTCFPHLINLFLFCGTWSLCLSSRVFLLCYLNFVKHSNGNRVSLMFQYRWTLCSKNWIFMLTRDPKWQ